MDSRQIHREDVFGPSSVARTSLNVKVKGQGHQGQKRAAYSHHPRQRLNGPFCCMTHCNALAANNVMQQQTRQFRRCRGVISAACVRFMFGKRPLVRFLFCAMLYTIYLPGWELAHLLSCPFEVGLQCMAIWIIGGYKSLYTPLVRPCCL